MNFKGNLDSISKIEGQLDTGNIILENIRLGNQDSDWESKFKLQLQKIDKEITNLHLPRTILFFNYCKMLGSN